ncbi:dihydrodipicolinate synthetase [Fusarium oxysporum f. sp. phaseoli]
MAKPLPSGVYAPLPAFFSNTDELDLKAYVEHAIYVAKPGVIPVVSATMGEAAHLDRQERIQLIRTLRSALDENGLHRTPIVAGVGATSTRETISLAKDAAAAGAEFVLVIAPSYYASALKANPIAIKTFFIDVALKSPLPIVIYNFPLVAGGIDLTSDDIVDIARTAPNICGIMLSCGNVGKVSRITSLLDESFKTIAGFIDFLLPSISVGSAGAISPLPNIVPDFAMELWRSTQSLDCAADWATARLLQEKASLAEAELLSGGVAGLKYLLNKQFGYPATPRRPLQPLSEDTAGRLSNSKYLMGFMDIR